MSATRHVVTRGYGNGTFNGAIKDVVTRGYLPLAPGLDGSSDRAVFVLDADRRVYVYNDGTSDHTVYVDRRVFVYRDGSDVIVNRNEVIING